MDKSGSENVEGPSVHHDEPTELEERNLRAKAFMPCEIKEMVMYLSKKKYDAKVQKPSYMRKKRILQKLAKKLHRKFGTNRSRRQIQKRYSDLKVRQPALLQQLREEIFGNNDEDSPNPSESDLMEQEQAKSLEDDNSVNTQDQETNTLQEEETVILNLEPIEIEQVQAANVPEKNIRTEADTLRFLEVQIQSLNTNVQILNEKMYLILGMFEKIIEK